ncbi:TKL family protein kinase [Tritrichomonas foetus]|uniref:TKL family protein kinase n=1 Tax=Tritrichomonas foetus TaxID=1144522 RepID=A0A1J4KUR4_9EUKA|nr:TKL family protein kinase [Tritrichomonas foetus]|eukprot:OHT15015.1 TKL family protein kinase [Tritrichomonas foetus]
MGPGISANYDQVTYIFTSGCWKVHSAISKTNNERVCLWTIDPQLLRDFIPDTAAQTPYLQGFLNGLQKARKLVHPRILKIIQIQDNLSNLAFSSEPVSSCLTTLIGSLDKHDSSYIGYQILDGLSFLQQAKMIHLGLTPSAVYLNETLAVKLFNFNWATPFNPDSPSPTPIPFPQFSMEPHMPNVNYVAPEVVVNRQCYPQSDIFSFCCVLFEMLTSNQLRQIRYMGDFNPSVDAASYALKISEDFSSLFSQVFQSSAAQRPTATALIALEPFQTVQVKVLRYIDMIIAKDPKDKFGFFKGLSKVITDFSPMMTKAKILPILIQECKSDPRFAPVLLGTIFSVSEKFSVSEFTNEVFKNISYLTTVTDPPHISIALLQWIPLILEKTEKSLHNDCVYPIIFNAVQSPNIQIQKECLKKLSKIIEKISESAIRTALLPKLVDLASSTSDPQIASSSIATIAVCLPKVDNDGFLLELFPKVFKTWKKHSTAEVAESMLSVILALNASNKNTMSRAMQVASTIGSNENCPLHIQKRFCNWMINTIGQFKSANYLDRQIEKPTEEEMKKLAKSETVVKASSTPNFQATTNPPTNTLNNSQNNSINGSLNSQFSNSPNTFNNTGMHTTSSLDRIGSGGGFALPQNSSNFQPFPQPPGQYQQQQPQPMTRQPRVIQGGGLSLGTPPKPKNDDLLNLF